MPRVPARDNDAARIRRAILKVLPEVLQRLYHAALEGDVQAARLLIDRALPALAPVRDAVVLDGDTPAEWKADLLAKVAGGQVAPREALAVLELFERLPSGDKAPRTLDAQILRRIRADLYGEEGAKRES